MITDSFGRHLAYLRISLTDRCNFRCLYCLPPEGVSLVPREELLTLEEIERLSRIFVSLGVTKIRLTGGEPLLRKRVVSLVAALSGIEGLIHLTMTTNGSLLAPLAGDLKEAGLGSINISLDSLSRIRFARITRSDHWHEVMYGITQALSAGLAVKINVVAVSDLSREEVLNFCALARGYPVEVRFLEFMPLCGSGWNNELRLPMQKLKRWVMEALPLREGARGDDVAETYTVEGFEGRIGFIASISSPFCGRCSRLRLTSTGGLRPCLFSDLETDLKTPLRSCASDDELAALIRRAAWGKPKGHEEFLGRMRDGDLPKIRLLGG